MICTNILVLGLVLVQKFSNVKLNVFQTHSLKTSILTKTSHLHRNELKSGSV